MNDVPDPGEIRRELGLLTPPFRLNEFRRYLGVTFRTDPSVRGGGVTTWNLDGGITVVVPPGPQERVRETGSHEFGHVANGDVGPHQAVLYARGSGRAAPNNPAVEQRATDWGVDALVGRGPLGIAIRHEEIKSADALARRFGVGPKFILTAAVRYSLDHLVLSDADAYRRYVDSTDWRRRNNEILSVRPLCGRCGVPAEVVQHTRFDTLGREQRDDVEALCRSCSDSAELGSALILNQLTLLSED
jgi:hypothetical protein